MINHWFLAISVSHEPIPLFYVSSIFQALVSISQAYTFIIYQQLMGGLRKRYANKSLTTFSETLEAFLTGISYNFLCWLQNNMELFAEHKARRGFVWG